MAFSFFFGLLMISTLFGVSVGVDLTYSVWEGKNESVNLGNIGDDSNIASLTTEAERQNLFYNFLNSGNSYSDQFHLEETTGAFSAGAQLDREKLCGSKSLCVLQLRIGASSGQFFLPINVNVTVKDINDQVPTFSKDTIDLPISENTPVGRSFSLISATDQDAVGSANSRISYDITPNIATFALKLEPNAQGGQDLSIMLKTELNYEQKTNYLVYVVAKDAGSPQKTGTLTLNILVEDYNDNKPLFAQNHYNKTIREDIALNSPVITVEANDLDSGDNGKVSYAFSTPYSMFAINAGTGEITVVQQLTASGAGQPVRLLVTASDSGLPQQSSVCTVDIHIIDINNHDPEINIKVLPNANLPTATIPENSVVNTVVAYVGVVDKDFGDNAKVNCTIKNSKFKLQKISDDRENEFKVVTTVELDREKDIEHVVTVICEDRGIQARSTSEKFLVEVTDVNDNKPVFSESVYRYDIKENNDIGVVVAKVQASDNDQGPNAKVMYFVEKDFATMFYAEPGTGKIKANVQFDRELMDKVTFTVLAIDGGSPVFTSSATVVIDILDENDEYPTFPYHSVNFSIMENLDADTFVGNISADDDDIGDNGRVLFSLPSQYQVTLPFVVFPNGEIRSNRPLNREAKPKYEFSVIATDQGVPAKSSSAKVIITVLDKNDNYPQIYAPVQNNGSVIVSHMTRAGTQVTKVEAYDLDEGRNGELVYSMTSDTDHGLFYIEETSGKIYLAKEIGVDDIKTYNLFIIVSDKGVKPKQSGTQIKLKIEYIKEPQSQEGAIGQNVLIAITIACVTIVLSLAIIVTIFLIRRVDSQKRNRGLPHNEHMNSYQIPPKKPCLTIGREEGRSPVSDTVNGDIKKEVSFSLDDHRDSGIFMIANDMPSPGRGSAFHQQNIHHKHDQSSEPQNDPSNDEVTSHNASQDELHRMASIRLHEKLLHSYNKPLVYHPDENRQLLLMKRSMEDSHSDGSGETTGADSGRGDSQEDMHHTSIMI